MRHIALAFAALLAATPALAQPAGTLRVGLASDIDTLDPVLSNTIAGRSVLTALCDKLLDVDERGANNDSKFCDPRVDAALEAVRATVDPAERARHYHAALDIALPARHRIYLTHEAWRFGHVARLSGFRALPDGIMRMEGIRLD